MEKVRYDAQGQAINVGDALKVRADVMLPCSATLKVDFPDGTTAGLVTIAWSIGNEQSLDALGAAVANFIVQFKAHATQQAAANDSGNKLQELVQ